MNTSLKSLSRRTNRASGLANTLAAERDEAIRQAYAAGITIRELAAVTGLSSARVHQILHNR